MERSLELRGLLGIISSHPLLTFTEEAAGNQGTVPHLSLMPEWMQLGEGLGSPGHERGSLGFSSTQL